MSGRADQLLETAERQIAELVALLSTADDDGLCRPCPGREKLGDGTVAALASHTADTYMRIAGFVRGGQALTSTGASGHGTGNGAETVDLRRLIERLEDARNALRGLAHLMDEQLDQIPPAGQARFCDGNRTVEQVLTSMLKHQGHQIDALRAAIA